MTSHPLFLAALLVASLLGGCGPRQFERAPAVAEEGRGFETVADGEDPGNVILSDDSDEAWNGVQTDGGEDWYEGEESQP